MSGPQPQSRRKQREGVVVSDRMTDTLVVRVSRLVRHPKYPRVVRRSAKVKVHAPGRSARRGDLVRIEETRPISKDKRWRLLEVLRKAPEELAEEQAR